MKNEQVDTTPQSGANPLYPRLVPKQCTALPTQHGLAFQEAVYRHLWVFQR